MAFSQIVCAPVVDRDRLILEHNEQSIVRLMDPDKISRMLTEKGVIDNNDRKQILLSQGVGERNRLLLGKLLTRGPEALKNYVNVLNDSQTDNHKELARILQNDDPIPPPLPVEKKLQDSRNKRISEKIEDHEKRIKYLEEEASDVRSDEHVESIRSELIQRNTELDELRRKLKTRDGELQEAKEENKALQKRVHSLEKKIQSLESFLKDYKSKVESMTKLQQHDKRCIRALEDKNTKLESRIDSTERKMEKLLHDQGKKLQDQEKRHHKEMEEIRQMIRDAGKLSVDGNGTVASKTNSSSRNTMATNTRNTTTGSNTRTTTTSSQQKANITPRNRFQSEEAPSQAKSTRSATRPPRAPQAVQNWKKSTPDPDRLPGLKPAQKNK